MSEKEDNRDNEVLNNVQVIPCPLNGNVNNQIERTNDSIVMQVPQPAGDNIRVNIKHAENVHYYYQNCTFYGKESSKYDKILNKRIKRLKCNYAKGRMLSLLWHDDRNDLPLADFFISITVDEDHMMGRFPIGATIQLDQIFFTEDTDGKVRRKRRILIRGNPGYGKSTLIRKLAYDWATLERSNNYLGEMFDVVLVIPIKCLGDKTIKEAVLNEMQGENDTETLFHALKESQLRFLLLLDGYDEAIETDKVLKFLKEEEEEEEFFLDVTVVVTSRPQAVDEIWKEFDRHLSVVGFCEQNKILYIKKLLGHEKEKMNNILEKLNSNQFLSELSNCPLMLHMFCCLQSEASDSSLSTLTGLYREIIRLLIRRYTQKHNNLSISAHEEGEHFSGENLILKLGKLASLYFKKCGITALSEDALHKTFPEEYEFKFVTGLDVLIPVVTSNESCKCLKYDFIHRTIAEFLAIFYITKLEQPDLNLRFSELLFHGNNLPVNCFFFGLMGEKILECEHVLTCLTKKFWEADWIPRLKEEMSHRTWDKLFLRQHIKKLSCKMHNFKKDAPWVSLHQFLEQMVVKINQDIRTDLVEIILSCNSLKSLTIYISSCLQFEITHVSIGTALLINMHFLMDDLIKLSSLINLKEFIIEMGDVNVESTSAADTPVKDCAVSNEYAIGLLSRLIPSLKIASWNIGKMEFRVSVKNTKQDDTKGKWFVVLLLSQEQYNKVTEPPLSYHIENEMVEVKGKKILFH